MHATVHTRVRNQNKKPTLLDKIVAAIFLLMFGLIPLAIITLGAINEFIPNLKSMSWDDATGTVISTAVTDTGRTTWISTGNKSSKKVRVYESILSYSYEDQGNTLINTREKELNGENAVKSFNEKYYQGALVKLKINPQDRSEVIVNPSYTSNILVMAIGFPIALGFFFLFLIYIPIRLKTLEEEKKDPSALRHKFETQKFRNIDHRDVEQQNTRLHDNIDWEPIHDSISTSFTLKPVETNSTLYLKRRTGCYIVLIALMLALGIFILTQVIWAGIVWCSFAVGIPIYAASKDTDRIFDKLTGYYWKGKNYRTIDELMRSTPTDLTPLSQIKALQILNYLETVHGKNGSYRVKVYELNLVLRDNKRVHVYKLSNLREILKIADQIAGFLNVQVILDPKIDKEDYLISL